MRGLRRRLPDGGWRGGARRAASSVFRRRAHSPGRDHPLPGRGAQQLPRRRGPGEFRVAVRRPGGGVRPAGRRGSTEAAPAPACRLWPASAQRRRHARCGADSAPSRPAPRPARVYSRLSTGPSCACWWQLPRAAASRCASRNAMMHVAATSPYYDAWVTAADATYRAALEAVRTRDLRRLGPLMRVSYLRMFGTMLAADPPINYLRPQSLRVLEVLGGVAGRPASTLGRPWTPARRSRSPVLPPTSRRIRGRPPHRGRTGSRRPDRDGARSGAVHRWIVSRCSGLRRYEGDRACCY